MSTMPAEITYGYVADRLVLAVGDGADGDRTPDARPAVGKVKFTPKTKVMPVSTPTPGRVLPQAIEASLDADGYLIDDQDAQGVWLVVGLYDVTYSFTSATVAGHEIEVTTAHTEAAPLYLTLAVPPGGPILTPSQYTELNNRLLVVEAGGGGGTGGPVSWTSVTGKPSEFPPEAHSHDQSDVTGLSATLGGKVDDTDPRLTDARTPTAHTHTVSDLTDYTEPDLSGLAAKLTPADYGTGTTDATTVLHGDGTWKEAAAGGGGGAVAGSVYFEARRSSSAGSVNLAGSTFTAYPLDEVVTNTGGGTYDTSTFIYTIPEDGLYLCVGSIRKEDGANVGSVMTTIATTNSDGPQAVWSEMPGERYARQYTRVARFATGAQVRLVVWASNGFATAGTGAGQSVAVIKISD